ncbi:helix-turn-helix transcriptional regulator [Sporosarcina sp. FSL K6-1508]|uniref:helix-turn-helix transcriptional regulator n=1 Tax=Sporosarcina sp. FSL K6-1508 TaxID=2921553 RepID=UPI0030FBF5C0
MKYEAVIQCSFDWIERNLHRKIYLEDVSRASNFSKFHFHRIFQSTINMSVDDYIRMRRLALASVQLIHSDERIINIALDAQFNSQEAFSRSFKKLYGLSPGEFRKTMRIITFKEGEKSQMESPIKGWFLSGSHPYHYKMDVDHKVVHEGRVSGYLKSETVLEEDEFATMMQQFKSDNYKGKRIKLSCFVKCDNVARFAGAWMRVDNQSGDVLQFDNMSNRPIVGTLDWNYYSIILDIPKESASISFGMLLQGVGEIWMDKFSFEEVDESVQTTNIEFFPEMLDEPVNLSFEEF